MTGWNRSRKKFSLTLLVIWLVNVEAMQFSCGELMNFFPNEDITVLVNMSPIKIMEINIWIHDQYRDLGKGLVCNEIIEYPGECSRIWCFIIAMNIVQRKGVRID